MIIAISFRFCSLILLYSIVCTSIEIAMGALGFRATYDACGRGVQWCACARGGEPLAWKNPHFVWEACRGDGCRRCWSRQTWTKAEAGPCCRYLRLVRDVLWSQPQKALGTQLAGLWCGFRLIIINGSTGNGLLWALILVTNWQKDFPHNAHHREISISISSYTLRHGDAGLVIVGGRMESQSHVWFFFFFAL